MKLFFIGCSHTIGDDLPNPTEQAWPVLVAKHYGYDFVNAATSGGTNERTVYHTIKNINNYDKFYIAWTYTSRITRYRVENNYEVNFNNKLVHNLYNNDPAFLNYGKLHYAYWHNQLWAFKQWLQQIIMLQSVFYVNNKKYLMINTHHNNITEWCSSRQQFNDSVKSLLCFDQMNDQQLLDEHNEIQSLLSQINFDYFLGWNDWYINLLGKKYPTSTNNHLLVEGHQAVAEYIIKHDSN